MRCWTVEGQGKGGVGWEVIYFNLFLREMALGVYTKQGLKRHL